MKMFEFLTESNGRFSSTRLMSFVALIIACYITLTGTPNMETLIIWITAAFCPKVVQKFAEKRGEAKNG